MTHNIPKDIDIDRLMCWIEDNPRIYANFLKEFGLYEILQKGYIVHLRIVNEYDSYLGEVDIKDLLEYGYL